MKWKREKYHYDVSPYPYFALFLRIKSNYLEDDVLGIKICANSRLVILDLGVEIYYNKF